MSYSTARRNLAIEEANEATIGKFPMHETPASAFINEGLELESQQYVVKCLFPACFLYTQLQTNAQRKQEIHSR
jgi:hypothetical protein